MQKAHKKGLIKIVAYLLLIALLTPFLTGFLLIEPVMAADDKDYKYILKGLLMMVLLAFVGDSGSDASNDASDLEVPEPDIAQGRDDQYMRYDPKPGELETLAKAIYSEARGEDYLGQVAVAAVILNRIDNSDFPDGIDGVVYQKVDGSYAFSAVWDGQIHLYPNQAAYDAARDALYGWDPTNGALYYYNPDTATADWIFENTVVTKRIGRHAFARRRY
jgi:N-acetylmuramoyl-L-alanine amidase